LVKRKSASRADWFMQANYASILQGACSCLEAMQTTMNNHNVGRLLLDARFFQFTSIEFEVSASPSNSTLFCSNLTPRALQGLIRSAEAGILPATIFYQRNSRPGQAAGTFHRNHANPAGLTPDMVSQIAVATRKLPVQDHYNYPPTTLEMQKVKVGRTLLLFSVLFRTDMEVSSRCISSLHPDALAELHKAGTYMFLIRRRICSAS
jgi:hypothetical protein